MADYKQPVHKGCGGGMVVVVDANEHKIAITCAKCKEIWVLSGRISPLPDTWDLGWPHPDEASTKDTVATPDT